jgi:hypothetical protein
MLVIYSGKNSKCLNSISCWLFIGGKNSKCLNSISCCLFIGGKNSKCLNSISCWLFIGVLGSYVVTGRFLTFICLEFDGLIEAVCSKPIQASLQALGYTSLLIQAGNSKVPVPMHLDLLQAGGQRAWKCGDEVCMIVAKRSPVCIVVAG